MHHARDRESAGSEPSSAASAAHHDGSAGPDRSARAEGQAFACRWMSVRRVRLAEIFSRLSVAALVAPVLLVYWVGAALEALRLPGRGFDGVETAIALFMFGTVGSVVLALVSVMVGAERRRPAGTVRASASGFTIEREGSHEHVPRDSIEGGVVLDSAGGPCVELHLADGRVLRAGMRSRNRARAMLDHLGMGPDRRRLVAPQGRPNHVLAAGCAAYPAAFVLFATALLAFDTGLGFAAPLLMALLVAGTTLIARRLARGAVVIIGAEGVSVRYAEPLGRFARFEHIARVSRSGRMLLLMLRDDPEGNPRSPIRVACADADLAEGLGERIEEAMARARGAPRSVPVAELLDPGDQPIATWREDLAKLLHGREQYRRAPVAAEDLLDVVEDPRARPALRIGAAIALRERRAPEDRERVRIAAETCADERVREALEAAAAEEEMADDVIANALATQRR